MKFILIYLLAFEQYVQRYVPKPIFRVVWDDYCCIVNDYAANGGWSALYECVSLLRYNNDNNAIFPHDESV